MPDYAIFWEWLSFAVRWLHVITAIAWIGSCFYFIALDLGLRKTPSLPPLAHGEEWQVHGGGFYHIQKYLVAPEFLPEHLTWFKWESYFTWISGFMLLVVVYYFGADLFLIDRHVLDVPSWVAILISLGSIVLGWVLYDTLCKSPIGNSTTGLMVVLFAILTAMAWAYTQVFTGRAAMLHMGAFTATIMAANVAMIIIPNQKIVVADLKAGRVPDAKYGKVAKQRSLHNNYLTLPVIFFMLTSPLPAGLRDAVELDHRRADLPRRRRHPALVQFQARAEGQSALDLGRRRHHLPRHRLAELGARRPPVPRGGRRSVGAGVSRQRALSRRQPDRHGALHDVPQRRRRARTGSTRRPRTSASTATPRSPTTRTRSPSRPAIRTPCRPATSPR